MELRHDKLDGVMITAILDDGKLFVLEARPDDKRLWTGDVVTATVMRHSPAHKAYFLKHKDGEVLFPSKTKLQDGESVTVTIERPATADKHARAVADEVSFPPEYDAKPSDKNLESYDTEILALLDRQVACGNGINIIIDEAAGATIIDVNAASPDLGPLEANRIAATEIFRQMRLRNLQGQILIDFLRLKKEEDKVDFVRLLNDLTSKDARKIDLYGFTRLGLFELTRGKRGLSLGTVFSLIK